MHARPVASRVTVTGLYVAVLLGVTPTTSLLAQEKAGPQSPPTAPARKSAASKSANVKSGTITALDAAADTLTLQERTGKSGVYVLSARTHYNRQRRAGQRSDFKPGDAAVLHFRKSRTDGALLVTELDDPASWSWLSELRKSTASAVVKEITDDTLSVTVGADNVPLDYTISDKTRWEKAGKEVEPSAFKAGDHVYIIPRSLPSGSIMARAVADTNAGAVQEKERLATSVHGTIASVDMAAHKLVMQTVAGDTRSLAFGEDTEVVRSSKPQPLSTLRPGLHVAARIRHEAGGDETVWRITIEAPRKSSPARKRVPSGKGVAKGI
jgi:hypothetical protein